MTLRAWLFALPALIPMALTGCANSRYVEPWEYNDPAYRNRNNGALFGDSSLFSTAKGNKDSEGGGAGTGLGVNAYLWRGALDTLSFMPLASADPFGGVIITDWFQPQTSQGERFKATAYILGRSLRADGVKVTIFRQAAQNGVWVDQPVNATTNSEIENRVLARARELRTQSGGS